MLLDHKLAEDNNAQPAPTLRDIGDGCAWSRFVKMVQVGVVALSMTVQRSRFVLMRIDHPVSVYARYSCNGSWSPLLIPNIITHPTKHDSQRSCVEKICSNSSPGFRLQRLKNVFSYQDLHVCRRLRHGNYQSLRRRIPPKLSESFDTAENEPAKNWQHVGNCCF